MHCTAPLTKPRWAAAAAAALTLTMTLALGPECCRWCFFLTWIPEKFSGRIFFSIVCQQLPLLRPFCHANCETNTSNQNAHIRAHLGAASLVFADPQEGRNRFGFVQPLKQQHHLRNALAKRQIDSIQSTMTYFIFFLFFFLIFKLFSFRAAQALKMNHVERPLPRVLGLHALA